MTVAISSKLKNRENDLKLVVFLDVSNSIAANNSVMGEKGI